MDSLLSSDSETENRPLFANKKSMASSDSSSDSDADVTPPKQARQGVRSVRGLSRLLKQKSEGFQPLSTTAPPEDNVSNISVYTSAVSLSMKAMKDGKLKVDRLADDVDEDEGTDLFSKKSRKKNTRTPKTSTRTQSLLEPEEDDVSFIGMEPPSASSSQERDKSPTPPPTPDMPAKAANKRKMKGVKQAIRTLDSVHEKFLQESQLAADEDGDVSIVEIVSPTAARLKEENKQITVNVRSRSGIQRFTLKKTEDLSQVFSTMAAHEFVNSDQVSLCLNDTAIQPYDTPACIGLTITDILECYVRKDGVAREEYDSDDPDVITLQVQGKDPKSKHTVTINKKEPLERMMRKYASKVGMPYGQLSFTFDGEEIQQRQTSEDLDLEDDFCVDVTGV